MFSFAGDMILSKSWLNRAQIIFYFAKRPFPFRSEADDVRRLSEAIHLAGKASEYHLGQGGTSFRFFVFLISRLPGNWKVFAEPQLLLRPQKPLVAVLNQLGVNCAVKESYYEVTGNGWSDAGLVTCDAGLSSQFVSGLLLSCWQLKTGMTIKVPKPVKSEEYLKMTLGLLQQAGMRLLVQENESALTIAVEKAQSPDVSNLLPEADVSSAFSLAAAAVIDGSAEIKNWPVHSSQPDSAFLKAFDKMNISYKLSETGLQIKKHNTWNGCDMDIGETPDLFPVLSSLCALGEGKSRIFGAEHLKVKESDRLAKTAELLKLCGVRFEELHDGLIIYGRSFSDINKAVTFDPGSDHRMAMAAAMFRLYGFNIHILNRDCVNKSYPAFWRDTGL